MPDVSLEEILILLIFILWPLLNLLLARLRGGAAEEPPAGPEVEAEESPWPAPHPSPPQPRDETSAAVSLVSPGAPRRMPRKTPLGNLRDLRRAIVASTVLGPCRADDPPS
ncbi:MAG TPA: hypothetical protein VI457_15320 [Methylococcaceae bacterium]|nr:hypothetical protein [Methylococcaceae bacterium]